LFLYLSKSSCKECSETSARSALTGSEFISEKLRRDTIVLIFRRSASQAQKPCKVCAGWLKVQNLSTERRVEGLLSQEELHRVKELKYLEVFEEVPQGVRAEVLFF
jgi:hypothetical protein